jgi:hypothetical protein
LVGDPVGITGRHSAAFLSFLFLLLVTFAALATPVAAAPAFTNEGELSSDTGQMLMSWQSEEPVTLVIGTDSELSDAQPVYSGSQQSYFLSGLANGDYYLRLDGESGASSDPIALSVAHQSLQQALWLTLIGLIITIGIIYTIMRGARDD